MPLDSFSVRSFAKINLALQVLGRRPDGYHELRTVFQTVSLYDTLRLARAARGELHFACRPPVLADQADDNLIIKAAVLMRDTFKPRYGAALALVKRIPMGGGLGGGSSNAAVTLLALNRLWGLGQPVARLHDLARTLGADVPFFLQGGTALGIGRGDEIYPCPPVAPFYAVLIYPGVSVSTSQAYAGLGRGPLNRDAAAKAIRMPAFCARLYDEAASFTGLFNDFEPVVLSRYPAIARAYRFLKRHGAAVLLSGSGSSVFGLYRERRTARRTYAKALTQGWTSFLVHSVSYRPYQKAIGAACT